MVYAESQTLGMHNKNLVVLLWADPGQATKFPIPNGKPYLHCDCQNALPKKSSGRALQDFR